MNHQTRYIKIFSLLVGEAVLFSLCAYAQEPKQGKLKVKVSPSEAYTFVDGNAMGPGKRSIRLGEGNHTVSVVNYGFKPFQQDISVEAGKTTTVEATLDPTGSPVSGPWGRIQIEVGTTTRGDYAVLLNGKSSGYFVGHVDEFNNNNIRKQELIVPARTHQVTVTRHGAVVWSGPVTVAANQRVIINIGNGKQRTKDWPRGTQLADMPRFKAGIASASVVVAPVSGSISATPAKIDCNQPSKLQWAALETVDNDISGLSPVPPSGERQVSPKQTSTYELTAAGPGGVVTTSASVEVNPTVIAQFEASPSEAQYRRIGDKVVTQESAALRWSSSNADKVSLNSSESVAPSGTRSVQLTPTQTTNGPVNETFNYTLQAANECGGSTTKTVAIHLTGSIEPNVVPPPTPAAVNSIFFPTDYPQKDDLTVGLLRSQKETLNAIADGFTKYLEYNPEAKLSVAAYADERGPQTYNESLSARRGQSVKDYLISKGVSEDKIEVSVYGDEKQLDQSTVDQLQTTNPNQPPENRVKNERASWLAHNRRVDIVLLPINKESDRYYPNNAPDSDILWQRSTPDRSLVNQNE